ncbi:hypothetical protein [Streptomyces sp. NPDC050287]|uniref:hypothetical protein n=1 Tax=Streptomyces sp. NPDC050287 TaxID=3365608 RepID=UPI0037B41B00
MFSTRSRTVSSAALAVVNSSAVTQVADFEGQDGDHELDVVAGQPRPAAKSTGINRAFGFAGRNAVLLLTAGQPHKMLRGDES